MIKVNGEEVKILKNSLNISDVLEERSTCSFTVIDEGGRNHYKKGQPVEIVENGYLIFAGVIDTPREQKVTPGGDLYHDITAADWHYLADKRIVARAYENTTAGDIVRDLVESYLGEEGVKTYIDGSAFPLPFLQVDAEDIITIHDGPIVEEAIFNYVPASQAMDALAEKA